MFAWEGQPTCQQCVEKNGREAYAAGRRLQVYRISDPTICGICKVDYGSSDLPSIGGGPVCANCAVALYERPYPTWLKLSLAGLLLLLGGSLLLGIPYFRAGRHLVLAERALDRKDYEKSDLQFAEVLRASPTNQKVVLLGAKASLMAGDIEQAQKFLKLRENYEPGEFFTEVNDMWNHALDANDKAGRAAKLAAANKDEEAAQLMHQASSEYPQSKDIAALALNLDGAVAFDNKDYDALLRITQAAIQMTPDDPQAEGFVASALACKYAVTGDPEFRKQAEETLQKAEALARKSPEEMASFKEYAERIRYRLNSRVIIDKVEYDRRFRQNEAKR